MRGSTLLIAAMLFAGCSGRGESNRGQHESVRPQAGPLSEADSLGVVRVAVAALQDSGTRRFEVAQFQRADSGYLVSLLPVPGKSGGRTLGGGGLVLVNSRRETRVIRRYR
jgi:hypothetical protein